MITMLSLDIQSSLIVHIPLGLDFEALLSICENENDPLALSN